MVSMIHDGYLIVNESEWRWIRANDGYLFDQRYHFILKWNIMNHDDLDYIMMIYDAHHAGKHAWPILSYEPIRIQHFSSSSRGRVRAQPVFSSWAPRAHCAACVYHVTKPNMPIPRRDPRFRGRFFRYPTWCDKMKFSRCPLPWWSHIDAFMKRWSMKARPSDPFRWQMAHSQSDVHLRCRRLI